MKENFFYLVLIRECLERIADYTRDGKDSFFASTMIQDAVVRNFEKISDAAGKVAAEIKQTNNEIPWERLAALQTVLLYPDMNAVWNTVEREVPFLQNHIGGLTGSTTPQ